MRNLNKHRFELNRTRFWARVAANSIAITSTWWRFAMYILPLLLLLETIAQVVLIILLQQIARNYEVYTILLRGEINFLRCLFSIMCESWIMQTHVKITHRCMTSVVVLVFPYRSRYITKIASREIRRKAYSRALIILIPMHTQRAVHYVSNRCGHFCHLRCIISRACNARNAAFARFLSCFASISRQS